MDSNQKLTHSEHKMNNPTPQRIGLLGGTFDPIHNGHLLVAATVAQECQLDEICFIPTQHTTTKQEQHGANSEDRYAMTLLATINNPHFTVSRVDIERHTTTYTIDTLHDIKKQHPTDHLFFIIGADNFNTFYEWKNYQTIPLLTHLIVVTRPGYALRPCEEIGLARENITFLTIPALDISSTMIRERLHHHQTIHYLVPDPVNAYIQKKGLYVS
ncbi:MAG: nicotinate-nucleotide adenylyltransferase [Aeriscardovia sp.]|nr:nicotinate-nucleotide adenylyltransferase [Aeriscardovia sp.]